MTLIALTVGMALLAGQTTDAAQQSASDFTRDLNSGPPFTPVSAPASTPAQPASNQASAPAAAAQTPAGRLPPIGGSQPLVIPPAGAAPTRAPAPAPIPTPAPTLAPTRVPTPPSSASSAAPAAGVLNAAAVAALPFTVDLSGGLSLVEGRPGPDFHIYSVKRGARTLAMIYAGPASQFPIYDGQMIQAGGRASIVVNEDGRRIALEHLFQRAAAPREVHVWIASVEGEDRVLAERVGQSVDIR